MNDLLKTAIRRIPVWPVYVLGISYPLWLLWQGVNGGLGVDPVKVMEHSLGKAGLQLVIAGLVITPLRNVTGISLIKYRRAIGLLAFLYICLHLLVWLVLDVQIPSQIWGDIIKRPYITIGMAGLLLMIPLAITSNNWSVRKLGRRWKTLHKLTYVVVVLGTVHYFMQVKGFHPEPYIYVAVVLGLLAKRAKNGGMFR
ncbi:protein-methionine-sulfoxide reductase heme-binding subunit MsrQ [Shimia thalassica]|uniref:protein-methionine-sulfoxide reductase heme-binding subunit MsrQ n=1 Tax=Shimia thalassica TaxID=1715693 RepID=UPI0026E3D3B0|nr:protein-methionine-sulfoxide reductase heme-binding subunit MsrQ [Shimia thalassica]MDO6479637.1 protein-methionine-sulfoxide reductase heme-binding subunit MsrQ [Shimia thalassica]